MSDGLSCMVFLIFFFFFQAEDGIRDGTVTGVQTCALPISRYQPALPLHRCWLDCKSGCWFFLFQTALFVFYYTFSTAVNRQWSNKKLHVLPSLTVHIYISGKSRDRAVHLILMLRQYNSPRWCIS